MNAAASTDNANSANASASGATKMLLEVRNLRVEFPTRRGVLTAIDDVSFSIAPGEVFGRCR